MGHAFRKPDFVNPESGCPASKSKNLQNMVNGLMCLDTNDPCAVDPNQEAGILNCLSDPRARGLLRTTWVDDFGSLYELGTDIYNEIFRLDPGTKKLFKALDGYDLEKDPNALRQCAGFSKQALRFIQTVSMAVRNCSRLSTIDEYLRDIGRRHVQYKQQGFEPRHWRVFETAMTNVIEVRALSNSSLDEADRKVLAEAYRELSRHIVVSMTAGFREAEREQCSKYSACSGTYS